MAKNISKIMALIFAAGLPFGGLSADEITTDVNRLPRPALEFASKVFPNAKIVGIEIDASLTKPVEYDVALSDGSKIDFDAGGAWTDVESKYTGVPASILPAAIASYVDSNYKGRKIKSVSKELYGWEVELIDGLELKFDATGKFVGVDR